MTGPGEGDDRTGRRAFFSPPGAPAGDPDPAPAGNGRDPASARNGRGPASQEAPEPAAGRRALFSAVQPSPGEPAGPASRSGVVEVECRTCLQRGPVSVAALVFSLVPSVWLPTRKWPHLMKCPHCGRVAWCRVHRYSGSD